MKKKRSEKCQKDKWLVSKIVYIRDSKPHNMLKEFLVST